MYVSYKQKSSVVVFLFLCVMAGLLYAENNPKATGPIDSLTPAKDSVSNPSPKEQLKGKPVVIHQKNEKTVSVDSTISSTPAGDSSTAPSGVEKHEEPIDSSKASAQSTKTTPPADTAHATSKDTGYAVFIKSKFAGEKNYAYLFFGSTLVQYCALAGELYEYGQPFNRRVDVSGNKINPSPTATNGLLAINILTGAGKISGSLLSVLQANNVEKKTIQVFGKAADPGAWWYYYGGAGCYLGSIACYIGAIAYYVSGSGDLKPGEKKTLNALFCADIGFAIARDILWGIATVKSYSYTEIAKKQTLDAGLAPTTDKNGNIGLTCWYNY